MDRADDEQRGMTVKRPKLIIGAAILSVISEAVLWTMSQSYGRLIDNSNLLGIGAFLFHFPGMMIASLFGLSSPDQSAETPTMVTSGAIQFFFLYWGGMTLLLHFALRPSGERHAPPNGGPAERLGNSELSGGPPSVS